MNTSRVFVCVFILANILAQCAFAKGDVFYPKTRHIKIKGITENILNVLPGRSVKILFPWVLSDTHGGPDHDILISNDNVFNYEYKEGQSFVTVFIKTIDKSIDGEVADLSISSNGYHFSLLLRASFRPSLHYSSIVLDATEAMKVKMIDDELRRLRASFDEQKMELENNLDERAKGQALNIIANLADGKTSSRNIKEDYTYKATDGSSVTIYIDKATRYGEFTMYKINVSAKRSIEPILFNSISISSMVGVNLHRPVQAYNAPKRIEPGSEAWIHVSTLNDKYFLSDSTKLSFDINLGQFDVRW